MKQVGLGLLVVIAIVGLLLMSPSESKAVPEYVETTGEPCAGCHISPAGGGLRTPRGMGWVAASKPAAVPSLEDALEILGVTLPAEPEAYLAPPEPRPAPETLRFHPAGQRSLPAGLRNYQGN